MASHRKPRQRSITGHTARTAATLALAGTAGATAFDGTSQAEPWLTAAQARAEVDRLYREAEEATEKYNGAKERADRAQDALDSLRDEAARKTERLGASRNAVGATAAAQYRSGGMDASLQLALDSSPDQYLERASLMDRAASRQAVAVTRIGHQLRSIEQIRSRADGELSELRREQAAVARCKRTITRKLRAAQRILDRLTAAQRSAVRVRSDGHGTTGAASARVTRTGTAAARDSLQAAAPTERAAHAVSFAQSALGKPYVWGATGPSAYDCSGLTQAAWGAAGVSLPRTTYTQINAGQRISRSELTPGDLVFFYDSISHVGLYIGNGQMIHAPHPGATVRIAPIDLMPFAGATRPS